MQPSIPGFLLLVGLLLLGRRLGSPIVIGLFASLPFASTALVTLSALGGSSPQIFTEFVLILLACVWLHRQYFNDIPVLFAGSRTHWVVLALMLYAILSAILLPRLFAGQATSLRIVPGAGSLEFPLSPTSGNITQTGYFVLGTLTYFAFGLLLRRPGFIHIVRRGYFTWLAMHTGLGLVDLLSKLAGAGDILAPIRTTSYVFFSTDSVSGFARIAGAYPEASAFGAATLSALAFTFTYWRVSRSPYLLALTVTLFGLLILSTSSAAYVGFIVIALFALGTALASAFRNRLAIVDLYAFGLTCLGLAIGLAVYLANEHFFDPIVALFDAMVFNKMNSESAGIRTYLNNEGIQAFFDTSGFGIGLGSSYTSSWVISLFSQLGVIGALMMLALVGVLFWDMVSPKPTHGDPEARALVSSARACALASLVGITIAGSGADPGLLFFIGLAVVVAFHSRPSEFSLIVAPRACLREIHDLHHAVAVRAPRMP